MPTASRRSRRRRHADHRHDAAELRLLTTEEFLIRLATAGGLVPPGVWRPLFDHELAARVNFADLAAGVDTAGDTIRDRIAAERRRLSEELLDELARVAASTTTPAAAVEAIEGRLWALADPAADAVELMGADAAALDTAAGFYREALTEVLEQAGQRVIAEAVAQGVPAGPFRPDGVAEANARRHAADLARHPVERVRGAAAAIPKASPLRGLSVGDALEAVGTRLDELSDAPDALTARTSAQQLDGLGRQAAAATVPRSARIYASELLDSATCAPCSFVDGVEYADLDDARRDYPAGTYRRCAGGDRCRGTLVFVWDTEAEPAIPQAPTPRPPEPEPPAPAAPARKPRPRRGPDPLAAELGITDAELRSVRSELASIRTAGRLEAARTQDATLGQMEARSAGLGERLKAPPRAVYVTDPVTGRRSLVRRFPDGTPAGAEYDFLERLHPDELKRLQRFWMAPGGGVNADELDDAFGALLGDHGTGAGLDEWLRLNRQADAAGALARGKLPRENVYTGAVDARDLTPDLVAEGYDPVALFGAEDDAVRHVLEVRHAHEAEYLDRYSDVELADVAAGLDALSFDEWDAELDAIIARNTIDVDAARFDVLVPPEFLDAADALDRRGLWDLITTTRRQRWEEDLF